MNDKLQNNINRSKIFFELYGQCQDRIFSFLFMMVHNEADAEDLLQDVAATMLENFGKYEQETSFIAWGVTIAKNKAINFLRKNAKTRPLFRNDLYEQIAELEINEEDEFSDRRIALEKCLKKLESSDRKILQMRYQQEFSMKKISEVMGRSKIGIYQTMARILSVLHKCIEKTMIAGQL